VALALLALAAVGWGSGVGRQPAPTEPFEEIIEDNRARSATTAAPTEAPTEPQAGALPVTAGVAPDTAATAPTDGATTATPPKPTPAEVARARREAKAKADAAKAATVPLEGEQTPAPAAGPVASPAPKVVEPPAPAPPKPAPPSEPCVGLSFLQRESCLWKQCDTEAFRRHPVCKRFNPDKSDLPPR
jgi:hypothetical protein